MNLDLVDIPKKVRALAKLELEIPQKGQDGHHL